MSEKTLTYQSTIQFAGLKAGQPQTSIDIETGTCTEAEPFALQVKGESMAPEFSDGCIVIVDPSAPPTQGAFVIADCGEHGYLLRQLNIEGDGWNLTATQQNHSSPEIKIAPDKGAILGVVIQQTGARRSSNKYYR